MLSVIPLAKADKGLRVGGDILALFPDKADPRRDLRVDRNAAQLRRKGQHGGEKEAAALALPHELERRGDLAGVHDDARLDVQRVKMPEQKLVLHGVPVI